ncbi:MAG TPA: hypothetical protein VIJ28_09705 [Chloroflexota bacterium]|jgi:predicted transposase YdaD
MPYVTSWERMSRAEGLEQGLEQGREEGREEGKRQAIRQVLAVRFDSVPSHLDERITNAGKDELDELLLRAAMAGSVEEL